MDWIGLCVRPGMTVVDVGANHGSITSQLRQAGATVWAVEPDPRCYRELCDLVTPDRVLPLALGATSGTTRLYRSRACEHNSLWEANVLEPGSVEAVEVELASLDDLQAAGRLPAHIDAIKVDTQGSELAILRGATRLCQTQRPAWYVEFWPVGLEGAGASLQALCVAFAGQGYEPEGRRWSDVLTHVGALAGHASQDLLLRA